jgi:hypothetical protein
VNSCIRPLHASVAMLALQACTCFVCPIPISAHCMRPLRDRICRHVHRFCAAARTTQTRYALLTIANDMC